jgi:polysaccharide biosynthesis transport protein
MLRVSRPSLTSQTSESYLDRDDRINAMQAASLLRRHKAIVLLCILFSLASGAVYIALSQPKFIASTQVLFDPRRPLAPGLVTEFGLQQLDSAQLESQIQIVRSEQISRYVVRQLGLTDNPEFGEVSRSQLVRLLSIFSQGAGSPAKDEMMRSENAILDLFNERLEVRRIRQSYVLEISFWSRTPETSARIANSVTAAYVRNQLATRLDGAQRGEEILTTRIGELQQQLAKADAAVRSGIIELDSFPAADARVLTQATPPLSKSAPKSMLVLAFSGFLGILIAGVFVTLRTAMDNSVRSRRQIERNLGASFLGSLPVITQDGEPLSGNYPPIPQILDLSVAKHSRTAISAKHRPNISKQSQRMTWVAHSPFSSFSNCIRSVKTEIDLVRLESKVQCIGVTSLLGGEGTSTLASNLAQVFAASGRSTLLMDCDVRKRTITKKFAGAAECGLIEALSGKVNFTDALVRDKFSGFSLLPIFVRTPVPAFCNILGSDAMCKVLQEMRHSYDVMLIDLQPLASVPDAHAISPFLDGFIIVVEYGRTPIDTLADALHSLDRSPAKVIGLVGNKWINEQQK